MPLDAVYLVVLFACGYSLIQPRLSTDEFFPRFRWSCLTYCTFHQADATSLKSVSTSLTYVLTVLSRVSTLLGIMSQKPEAKSRALQLVKSASSLEVSRCADE